MLIVDVLKRARHLLTLKGFDTGMCGCIKWVCDMHFLYYTNVFCITQHIPEFNAFNLTGRDIAPFKYWWPLWDKESRIEAFDKLIKLYENSDKEWT